MGGAPDLPRLTRRQALLLVGAAMVALTLGVTQAVLDARGALGSPGSRRCRARSADRATRREPLQVLSTLTVDGCTAQDFFLVGDLLLTEQRSGARVDGPGPVRHRRSDVDRDPRRRRLGRLDPPCTLVGPRADPQLLVCLVTGAATRTADTDTDTDTDTSTSVDPPEGADRLVVLDPRTGAVRAERSVRSPDGIAAVGDHVALVEIGPAARPTPRA